MCKLVFVWVVLVNGFAGREINSAIKRQRAWNYAGRKHGALHRANSELSNQYILI